MLKMLVVAIIFGMIATSRSAVENWPCRESIYGFWPLAGSTQLVNLVNGEYLAPEFPALSQIRGPFEQENTSYTVQQRQNVYIGRTMDFNVELTSTFSLSFFFNSPGKGRVGVASFSGIGEPIMAITYNNSDLVIYKASGYIACTIPSLLKPNEWNFVALTFDGVDIRIYSANGDLIAAAYAEISSASKKNAIYLGTGKISSSSQVTMTSADSLACFMYYKRALSAIEISSLSEVCRTQGQGEITSTTSTPKSTMTTASPLKFPQSEELFGFWPLDRISELDDIANNHHLIPTAGAIAGMVGPFGQPMSSYSVTSDGAYLAFTAPGVPFKDSYTISFFFFSHFHSQGGILMLRDPVNGEAFSIGYNMLGNIEIWTKDGYNLIVMKSLAHPDQWNFMTLTFYSETLTFYGSNGQKVASTRTPKFGFQSNNNEIHVGRANSVLNPLGMRQSDAIACLTYHTAVLTPGEIAQLPGLCQTRGYGTTLRPSTTQLPSEPWPRDEALYGFWVLDEEYGVKDAAKSSQMILSSGVLSSTVGPFGLNKTSYTVSHDKSVFISCTVNYNFPIKNAFTVSFYIYSKVEHEGGLFMIWASNYLSFSISFNVQQRLELWKWTTKIGSSPIMKPNQWNFFAVSYIESQLQIYDENANILDSFQVSLSDLLNYSYYQAYIGSSKNAVSGKYVNLRTSDAMACVMYYTDALTATEIGRLPDVCRRKGRLPTTKAPTTTFKPGSTPWPRPESLLALWPLDENYGARDAGHRSLHGTFFSGQAVFGPYGDPKTATSPKNINEPVLSIEEQLVIIDESFTVSLFFRKSSSSQSGGIFQFATADSDTKAFQVRYTKNTLLQVAAEGQIAAEVQMIQQNGAWTFVSLTWDFQRQSLSIYSRHGLVSTSKLAVANSLKASKGIDIGFAILWAQGLHVTDAISCVSVYADVLKWPEIKQLQQACRILHGSLPCGSPRIPLAPIPGSTSMTATPKPGQFPFLAAIRSASNICTASIIDEYWLITSQSCFNNLEHSLVPDEITVTVGEHDLNVNETHQRIHKVKKVLSGDSAGDLALVQVEMPIDFTNEYVNNICLFDDQSELDQVSFDQVQFVFGWGLNGRQPVISSTLPRYVPGLMLADGQCTQAWGTEHNATTDVCFLSSSNDKNVPCVGDEGSALLIQSPGNPMLGLGDRLIQYGTYFKRDSACSLVKPGLFIKIENLSTWIAQNIACSVPGYIDPASCLQGSHA